MKRKTLKRTPLAVAVLLSSLLTAASAQTAGGGTGSPLRRSRQLVVVTTPGWDSVGGALRRFERASAAGSWRQVGPDVPVVVGRTGLAWGVGVGATGAGAAGPVKREGDGKAPAGVFRLGSAFGFATPSEAAWLRTAYTSLTPTVECVDDSDSRHYNRIVDRAALKVADWNSSEKMREVEGYRWGLVVEHNAAPPAAGRGSCIFLHVWAGPGQGTAGCTAMERPNLEALLRWLAPRGRPLLVQLPESEYARLRRAWRLPPAAVAAAR